MKQNPYEITYLTHPGLSEEDRGALHASVDELVSGLSGTVIPGAPALRKRLAYKIKKQDSAFMRVMNIELAPAKLADVQDFLKRAEGVMRFTVLATPPRVRMSPELMEKHGRRAGKDTKKQHRKETKEQAPREQKKVTMQDVEKGIEEALTEEVK